MPKTKLKRTITLSLLVLYGLGTMLGAGIYVLLGKVAGLAGIYMPLAFAIASIVAAFTALSYAELSSRFPESAGEVIYVQKAFSRSWLSAATGWLVIATGTISAATIANGFTGYLNIFFAAPEWLAITLLIIALGLLAAWGISQSVWTAAVITIAEILGLLLVIGIGGSDLVTLPEVWSSAPPAGDLVVIIGMLAGAQLAFYAYIGFEDMINIAEEVKNPRRNLPIGIVLALIISSIVYILVALVGITSLSLTELVESDAPLALIVTRQGYSPAIIAGISLLAVVNGALVQIIMASRVLYGMAKHGLATKRFADVNIKTRTPLQATALMTLIVLVIALALPIESLAKLASSAALLLFALINGGLIRIKMRAMKPEPEIIVPVWIPAAGLATCIAMVAVAILGAM